MNSSKLLLMLTALVLVAVAGADVEWAQGAVDYDGGNAQRYAAAFPVEPQVVWADGNPYATVARKLIG